MPDQKLAYYVKSSLERGVPLSRIRSDLYGKGWPKKDIEEAIASAGPSPMIQPAVPSVKEERSRKGLYIAIIIVILAGIGAATYLTVLAILPPATPPPLQPVCGDGICEGNETFELCPADCAAPASNASVTVNPQPRTVSLGESQDFSVDIYSISNLYGFQFDLQYDPAILNFTKSVQGAFLSRNGAENIFCTDAKVKPAGTVDYVTIACTRLGAVGGVSGSGTLASFTFMPLKSGIVDMRLINLKLVDSNNKRIDSL